MLGVQQLATKASNHSHSSTFFRAFLAPGLNAAGAGASVERFWLIFGLRRR
jgi:hypothetical protein